MKVRLFPGGPEFPAKFLDLIHDGRMVFFCGAGLSVGTGLPTFSGLVRELDKILNPDPAHRFDYRKRKDYDRMLDELEGQFSGRRRRMCEHIRDILFKPPSDPRGMLSPDEVLENHRNILKLTAVPDGGFRLVTTNFDDRFALANGGTIQSKDWPELPSLKDGQWASLVHLHGRICDGAHSENLILTASDFGDAYILQNSRAAGFVIELLRRWPVAFVGYGLNDPPMDYLVRAVYNARNSPEIFQPAFALVGCQMGEEDRYRREWEGKRVVPIFYNNADDHKALREVLDHLARLKDEPGYRTELAIRGMDGNPDDEDGDHGRRVIWALRDSITARDFSKNKTFMDPQDGDRFVRWLNAIKKSELFRVNSAMVNEATIDPLFASAHVPPPPIAVHLACWIAQRMHQPALLWWFVSENMSLHPWFVQLLASYVRIRAGSENAMPDSLAEKWQLFIQERSVPPPSDTLLPACAMESKLVKSNLERHILSVLRPQVRVVPRTLLFLKTHEKFEVDVTIGGGAECVNMMAEIEEWINMPDFVVRHAETLSVHLEDAASLAKHCSDGTLWGPSCFQPDEDTHSRHSHLEILACLVRDAVLGMIEAEDVSRLKYFVSRWMSGKHILLRRLALYSITETAKLPNDKRLPADWGAKILMTPPDTLWSSEAQSENLRFLRKAGADITPPVRAELEGAIRKGPSQSMDRAYLSEKEVAEWMRRRIVVRLAKLKVSLRQSEATLSPESDHMLVDARNAQPEEKFEDAMEPAFKVSALEAMPIDRGTDPKWAEMTAEECANHIQSDKQLNTHSLSENQPDKAIEAFEILAKRGVWKEREWSLFLNGFDRDQGIPDKIAIRLIRLLEAMPDELALALVRDCVRAMQIISRTQPFSELERAWHRAWEFDLALRPTISSDHHISQLTVAINHAHGQLAEVPFNCFERKEEREKLLEVLAKILAGENPSHKYGKIVIGSRLFPLSHDFPEWTRQHLLPFFQPGRPMAFGMWDAFLYHPRFSKKLLAALKPGLTHFLQRADDFHQRASNLVGIFVVGGLLYPEIIPQDEKRRIIAEMSPQGIQYLCQYLERELRGDDGAALAKAWRERIFPFLRDVWPEKRWTDRESSDISQALVSLVMLTGDAFPDAFRWAENFLSPIVTWRGGGHPVSSFCHGRQKQKKNIPIKFPRVCLFFLHRIIPNEEFPWHLQDRLNDVLDKMKAAAPDLEKRPEFIRLRKIASGG